MPLAPHERFALLAGPYAAPKCRIGSWLTCRVRGRVKVVGISDAPIPWPIVVRANGGGRGLALVGDLIRAVRTESAEAIKRAWRVGANTVWTWRKVLSVGPDTPGSRQLRRAWWTKGGVGEASKPARMASLSNPERAAKIAAAKRGVPRPQHVIDAMRNANKGRSPSAETRAKMSEAHRARGTHPPAAGRPFEPHEDARLGTAPDREIAEQIGRDLHTVARRRKRLGIESFRRRTAGW